MRRIASGLIALLLCLACGAVAAASLDELIAADRLRVDSAVEPARPLVPGQKGRLQLRVATDRWFAGGTRIRLPEVPGLIVLQRSEFATNSSERRGGTTWAVQTWTLDVYATAEGRFATGPITLEVEISTVDGVVSGALRAPSVTVIAARPPELDGAGQWLAAPRFEARQRFQPEVDELRPGEAITRVITLEAGDVLEQMLPAVDPGKFEGLAAYPRPPRLSSEANRGRSSARRIQEITYVAEQAGTYELPGYTFAWWDTDSGRLRQVTLEPRSLTVTGPPPEMADDAARRARLVRAAGLLVLGLIAWAAWRWLPWNAVAAAVGAAWRACRAAWRRWRAPALPRHLNPWH